MRLLHLYAGCTGDVQLNSTMQAAAFKRGLELSPADRMMRQGFWDAMSLLSQRRGDAAALAAASTDGSDVPRLGEVVDAAVIATRSLHDRAGAAAF